MQRIALSIVFLIFACTIRPNEPVQLNVGENESLTYTGNLSFRISLISHNVLRKLDTTFSDNANGLALVWVYDTLGNEIQNAQVILRIKDRYGMLLDSMLLPYTNGAYSSYMSFFYNVLLNVDIKHELGEVSSVMWSPNARMDSPKLGNTPIAFDDTIKPNEGDYIVWAYLPTDDILLPPPPNKQSDLYVPNIVLISKIVTASQDVNVYNVEIIDKQAVGTSDTIVFDSLRLRKLFPLRNATYDFYILLANYKALDTNIQMPMDTTNALADIYNVLSNASITVSDVLRFKVVR